MPAKILSSRASRRGHLKGLAVGDRLEVINPGASPPHELETLLGEESAITISAR